MLVENSARPKVWRLVLTGGPCGGKTTGQSRLATFFENIGWKVYRVPETANVLLSGGVNFAELSIQAADKFQANLLKTMMQIENSFFDLASSSLSQNCLVICDRGTMDASAFVSRDQWDTILSVNDLDEVDIRDNRYNQVIHMVSAASGAEDFYSIENHASRKEGIEEARERDIKAAESWVGHPNVDLVDNRGADFESKINYLISKVAWSIGIDVGDRLMEGAKKVKFVVNGPLPDIEKFPEFRDFDVCHHYLQTVSGRKVQIRLRKRGCNGKYTYNHTTRQQVSGQVIEIKKILSHRDYLTLVTQMDPNHFPVYKTRRCFLWNNQYFQLDIYKDPCHERCNGLILLQTYTPLTADAMISRLPPFLNIGVDVTGDAAFSMFNLSLKEDWADNKTFCYKMCEEHENHETDEVIQEKAREAQNRLNAKKSIA